MTKPSDIDLLVVGQGLAGTALAWTALRHGLDVRVADPDPTPGRTASRVAAGLVTPLTGKKINPGWRLGELMPAARDLYDWAGQRMGRSFFHDITVWRSGRQYLDAEPAELTEQRHDDVFFDRKMPMKSPRRDTDGLADALDRRRRRSLREEDVTRGNGDIQSELLGTALRQRRRPTPARMHPPGFGVAAHSISSPLQCGAGTAIRIPMTGNPVVTYVSRTLPLNLSDSDMHAESDSGMPAA